MPAGAARLRVANHPARRSALPRAGRTREARGLRAGIPVFFATRELRDQVARSRRPSTSSDQSCCDHMSPAGRAELAEAREAGRRSSSHEPLSDSSAPRRPAGTRIAGLARFDGLDSRTDPTSVDDNRNLPVLIASRIETGIGLVVGREHQRHRAPPASRGTSSRLPRKCVTASATPSALRCKRLEDRGRSWAVADDDEAGRRRTIGLAPVSATRRGTARGSSPAAGPRGSPRAGSPVLIRAELGSRSIPGWGRSGPCRRRSG